MFGLGPCASLQRDCNNQAALLPAMSATHAYQSRWILSQKRIRKIPSKSGVLIKSGVVLESESGVLMIIGCRTVG